MQKKCTCSQSQFCACSPCLMFGMSMGNIWECNALGTTTKCLKLEPRASQQCEGTWPLSCLAKWQESKSTSRLQTHVDRHIRMARPQSTAKVAKAINIYLDIVQLFLFLLQLLGERKWSQQLGLQAPLAAKTMGEWKDERCQSQALLLNPLLLKCKACSLSKSCHSMNCSSVNCVVSCISLVVVFGSTAEFKAFD